jgi:hypothetical protein
LFKDPKVHQGAYSSKSLFCRPENQKALAKRGLKPHRNPFKKISVIARWRRDSISTRISGVLRGFPHGKIGYLEIFGG